MKQGDDSWPCLQNLCWTHMKKNLLTNAVISTHACPVKRFCSSLTRWIYVPLAGCSDQSCGIRIELCRGIWCQNARTVSFEVEGHNQPVDIFRDVRARLYDLEETHRNLNARCCGRVSPISSEHSQTAKIFWDVSWGVWTSAWHIGFIHLIFSKNWNIRKFGRRLFQFSKFFRKALFQFQILLEKST